MSYAKNKGTAFETATVNLLLEVGFETPRRIVMFGAKGDKGDIWIGEQPNIPDIIIECKSRAKESSYNEVEGFLQEAQIEYYNALNDNNSNYKALVMLKRPNLGSKDGYLIWKNSKNITIRAKISDVLNKSNFSDCTTEQQRIIKLIELLKG